jgi:hypothetical protein
VSVRNSESVILLVTKSLSQFSHFSEYMGPCIISLVKLDFKQFQLEHWIDSVIDVINAYEYIVYVTDKYKND